MKISGDIYNVSKVYNKQNQVQKVNKTSSITPKKDVISISDNAKDYQTVARALRDVPDVRQGKINQYEEAYQSGSYDVNGREIVEKLGKSILDKKA